jgi:hypothetical protein
MTRLLLLLLFALLAPVTAQAGAAEQSLTRANAKVRAAVLPRRLRGARGRKARPARRRGPRGLRLDSLDAKDDPEGATQTFCEFGRGLQKRR